VDDKIIFFEYYDVNAVLQEKWDLLHLI